MFSTVLLPLFYAVVTILSPVSPSDRVVALVISVGEGSARADAIQAQLQVLGAETLRSADPNNAELRSMLKRFAAESANTRASLVYLDMPGVQFQGRPFVLPANTVLNRPTDLFTRAVPVSAFARAAAQSAQGGAVILSVGLPGTGTPQSLVPIDVAPDPVPGAGPVLVARYGASDPIVREFAGLGGRTIVDVRDMLQRMSADDDVSVSDIPGAPIYLKSPPEAPAQETPVEEAALPADDTETVEELAILEKSLSRSAKRALQRALRDRDHYKGLVDGIFGPQTREAIVAFQTARTEAPTGFLTRRQLLDLR